MKTFADFMQSRIPAINRGEYDAHHTKYPVQDIRRAALAAARRDTSNPFAFARAVNSMHHIYTPSELLKDAISL